MKMSLRWRISPTLDRKLRGERRAAMARLALKLGLLTLGLGLPLWYGSLFVSHLLIPHLSVPRRSHIGAHLMLGAMAAYFWLLPLRYCFPLSAYKLTPQGVGRDPVTTRFDWNHCTQFSLETDEKIPELNLVKITNDRGRIRHLILPDDERAQDLIVRYLARKLPYQESTEPRRTG